MRWAFLALILASECSAAPPFTGVMPKPPIHPYTYFGPQSTPMDLQQMTYLREKYEYTKPRQQQNPRAYIPYEPWQGPGIRPTGHKTYFMNIP